MSDFFPSLHHIFPDRPPYAIAHIYGNDRYPDLHGTALFYPFRSGCLIYCKTDGLPSSGFFAFHLHDTADCSTGGDISFHRAGGHYNPSGVGHPDHAGDFPVLLSDDGFAVCLFYSGRFIPAHAVGRSLVIHARPDDYRSQPAGNSGDRIACGIVRKL